MTWLESSRRANSDRQGERYRQAAEERGFNPAARPKTACCQPTNEGGIGAAAGAARRQSQQSQSGQSADQLNAVPKGHSSKLPPLSGAATLMFLHLPARSPN